MNEINEFLDWFFSQNHYAISNKEKILLIEKNNVWEDALEIYEKEILSKKRWCKTCKFFRTTECPCINEDEYCTEYREKD